MVLCLHDTTVLDFPGLTSIPELGPVGDGDGDGDGRGLYCHNCLAVSASTREVLGLAGQKLHRRRTAPRGESRPARRANPGRESLLWKALSRGVPAAPAGGPPWVDVADRGADITEFLDYGGQAGKRYLKPHDLARSRPAGGRRTVETQAKDGRPARAAEVGVSWQEVAVRPPRQSRGGGSGRPLTAWVVRAWEADPPPGVEPLEWILLTNVPVRTLEQAFERIDWYGLRWIIEEYHKAQKTGCNIEGMRFSHVSRLEPAVALLSVVAVMLLNLRDQSRAADAKERPATTRVPALWVRMLSRWRHKEVRKGGTVHDFFYALARLGGHQNRKDDHRPGWLVLWRGWMHLHAMLEGAAAVGVT